MPHHGQYEHVKEWLQDHDSDVVDESPPIQNQWYEVFHAEDVRLIWCVIYQDNDENAAKDVEVRWTIDGNVYLLPIALADATTTWVWRSRFPSAGGTAGLLSSVPDRNAALSVDKRGLDFKVEIRMTALPGTNQTLICWCVRETLEVT